MNLELKHNSEMVDSEEKIKKLPSQRNDFKLGITVVMKTFQNLSVQYVLGYLIPSSANINKY